MGILFLMKAVSVFDLGGDGLAKGKPAVAGFPLWFRVDQT